MADESDVSLPKATLQKLMKDLVPPDTRLSSELTDLLIKCCTEFVHTVSSEANELCSQENKTTILPDHVLRALSDLGFGEFLDAVRAAHEQFKEDTKGHVKFTKKKPLVGAGMSEEEQMALQQKLFAEARARSMSLPNPTD